MASFDALPDEVICIVFEQLSSSRDVFNLRQCNKRCTGIFRGYSNQFRRAQQEKIVKGVTALYTAVLRLVGHGKANLLVPEGSWNLQENKTSFTLDIMNRLPVLKQDLWDYWTCQDILSVIDWRPQQEKHNGALIAQSLIKRRLFEREEADLCRLDHRKMISLTAWMLLDVMSAKIYCWQGTVRKVGDVQEHIDYYNLGTPLMNAPVQEGADWDERMRRIGRWVDTGEESDEDDMDVDEDEEDEDEDEDDDEVEGEDGDETEDESMEDEADD